jgi:hypothetical protein
MLLQSPDISDETFEYKRGTDEHASLLVLLGEPLAQALQLQLFASLGDAENLAQMEQTLLAGVATFLGAHHRMLLPGLLPQVGPWVLGCALSVCSLSVSWLQEAAGPLDELC